MVHNLTKDDWQLYDTEGAGDAAKILSSELNRIIRETRLKMAEGMNCKAAAHEVIDLMSPVMRRFSDFGAEDSEPGWALTDAVWKEFGLEK